MAYSPLQIGDYDHPDMLGIIVIDFKFEADKFELYWSAWDNCPSASRHGSKVFKYNKIQAKLSLEEADAIGEFIDDLLRIYPSITTVVIPETIDLWENLIDGFIRDWFEYYHDMGTLEPEPYASMDDVETIKIYAKNYPINRMFERESIKSLASLIRHEHYLEKVLIGDDENPVE